ncbi:Cupin domain protein [Neorhodopirellula lusitana]|uniref:Cupin domain protein n=1 Tax=Neorhodopirellula lusitana TaxID=445327 RepID=A0ABY1Q5W2_9BACT|nr:cupin domain-containing protein [Neorhodopirellula lusitana]SMP59702.1 Cupin domain protein [Neorhodopirellula lusitana]
MAIQHAQPAEVISVAPLGSQIGSTKTSSLLKTESLEVLRLVMPAGKKIAEHKAPGEITVHCLEGLVKFTAGGKTQDLTAGQMLYLDAAELHAVEAVEDSSVLVTLLLHKKS